MSEHEIHLESAPLPLTRALAPDDERVLDKHVIATSVNGRLIARCVMSSLDWAIGHAMITPDVPVIVRYIGTPNDPGIHATLWAILPSGRHGAFIAEGYVVGLFLGIAVRYTHDRKYPDDFAAECADHFSAILDGRGVEPIDRALAGL